MFSSVRCPICGHEQSVPEHKMGRKIACPSCDTPFLAGASGVLHPNGGQPGSNPPGAPLAPTVQQTMPPAGGAPTPSAPGGTQQSVSQSPQSGGNPPMFGNPANLPPPPSGAGQSSSPPSSPPNPTMMAQPEGVIRYSCPRCKKGMESPASMAGQKIGCSTCGQRLKIPESATPAKAGVDKTMLAVDEQIPTVAPGGAPPPLPAGAPPGSAEAPKSEAHCLECGRSLEGRDKLMTCPDCGSVFCSSACQRDHREYAHGRRRKRRRRRPGFECPFCGADEPPYWSEVISEGGWVMFAVMLLFCFPLFWIGLLMKEERRYCTVCNARV